MFKYYTKLESLNFIQTQLFSCLNGSHDSIENSQLMKKKLNSNSLVSVHKEVHTNFVKTDLCQNKMTNK